MILVLQIIQNSSSKYCPYLYVFVDQIPLPKKLWFKCYMEKCILFHLVQLTINLTRGNLRSKTFLFQRTWKIMTPLRYN